MADQILAPRVAAPPLPLLLPRASSRSSTRRGSGATGSPSLECPGSSGASSARSLRSRYGSSSAPQGLFTSFEVASPVAVFDAARELAAQGVLQSNLLISLQRVLEGLLLGVGTGVFLAVLCGLFWVGEDLIDPVIQALRAVPILGLVPLVIIWFGVGEAPKVFLIALGSLFPIYLNTYAAIRNVDNKLVEAGRTFGLSRLGLVFKVILPGALPGFLVGLRFALVGSWIIDVVAEEINAQSGLGYLINQAQATNRIDIMFCCLTIYAILGLVADAIVRLLERRMLAWRAAFAGA